MRRLSTRRNTRSEFGNGSPLMIVALIVAVGLFGLPATGSAAGPDAGGDETEKGSDDVELFVGPSVYGEEIPGLGLDASTNVRMTDYMAVTGRLGAMITYPALMTTTTAGVRFELSMESSTFAVGPEAGLYLWRHERGGNVTNSVNPGGGVRASYERTIGSTFRMGLDGGLQWVQNLGYTTHGALKFGIGF